jgi:D-glycero-D-manno-heptose 1,7-bisphosphate phosphatase
MGIGEPVSPRGRASQRAVFLDRDGVINRALVRNGLPFPPASWTETEILPGVSEALRALKDAGFILVIVTNQPDVARGTARRETVEQIHAELARALPIDRFEACYHDGPDACSCRKPKPGMLLRAAQALDINLSRSYMVGDRWRDIEAGAAAGCTTVFIDHGYKERQPLHYDFRTHSLHEASSFILNQETP